MIIDDNNKQSVITSQTRVGWAGLNNLKKGLPKPQLIWTSWKKWNSFQNEQVLPLRQELVELVGAQNSTQGGRGKTSHCLYHDDDDDDDDNYDDKRHHNYQQHHQGHPYGAQNSTQGGRSK